MKIQAMPAKTCVCEYKSNNHAGKGAWESPVGIHTAFSNQ